MTYKISNKKRLINKLKNHTVEISQHKICDFEAYKQTHQAKPWIQDHDTVTNKHHHANNQTSNTIKQCYENSIIQNLHDNIDKNHKLLILKL